MTSAELDQASAGGGRKIRHPSPPNGLKLHSTATGTRRALDRPVTAPRIIVAGATTAISRRTTLRKAFLAPWHPLVSRIWLYALADAQLNTGVAVHHGVTVVTHHHLVVTPERESLPEFTQRVHHDVSCALNTLLAQERYDAPGDLFDGRSAHQMRLLDAPAQTSQLLYDHNNCVAAGLVSRPEHMPGHVFDFELWRTGHIDVERPPVYFGDDRPDTVRLYVTPPQLLYAAFGGDLDWLVYHLKRSADDAARTLRAARCAPNRTAGRSARRAAASLERAANAARTGWPPHPELSYRCARLSRATDSQ